VIAAGDIRSVALRLANLSSGAARSSFDLVPMLPTPLCGTIADCGCDFQVVSVQAIDCRP
jgi:hypothetical protein